MRRRVLDTQVLIQFWLDCLAAARRDPTDSDVSEWADDLIALYSTDVIVTPVYIEMVAGAQSKRELNLKRSYLARFRILDRGKILDRDWVEARRLAERVPRDGKRRQLGDCLIKAIANRFGYDVFSHDQGFPS
ncbi:MAG: PIN domain-containing protein [Pirellulales bacterium]